jgi:hypothetical protein
MTQALQFLHSKLHPVVDWCDIRHPEEEIILYDINKEFVKCEGIRYTPSVEHTGMTHLVDAWFAQGHHSKNVHSSQPLCPITFSNII